MDPPNGGISAVVNLIERRTLPEDTFLVSLDVTTLYTNIPQEEGKNIVCRAYDILGKHPCPHPIPQKIPLVILQENSFEFTEKT